MYDFLLYFMILYNIIHIKYDKNKGKNVMSKTIMLDDKTYAVLKKRAKAEDRSISKMAKILISKALGSEEHAAAFDASPYSPVDWGSEPDPEVERKPIRSAWGRDMTEEELRQMSQSIRNKSYYNQEMSDEE